MHGRDAFDRKSLQTQLENYKLIVDVNTDLEDDSLFTKEGLTQELELAQSYLNDSDAWGKLGDWTKSYDALSNANLIIVDISAVLKHILKQDPSSDDSDLQPDHSSE